MRTYKRRGNIPLSEEKRERKGFFSVSPPQKGRPLPWERERGKIVPTLEGERGKGGRDGVQLYTLLESKRYSGVERTTHHLIYY